MFLSRITSLALFAVPLALVACANDASDSEAPASSEGAIENGTKELNKVPVVSYGTICTATFVSRARCLITASHCSGGSLEMGADVNQGFADPNYKTSYTIRSLSLRDSTPEPRWDGGSFDWSPADDIRILWAGASPNPGQHNINHATDYTPLPLDFSAPNSGDRYTIHGYGYNVCDTTGDGVLRYGTFLGGRWTNATGSAIPGVRTGNTSTLLKLTGAANFGICEGDSGSSVKTSAGVRAVTGWSINGSNDGYATTLAPYRPWFERNVLGTSARFCNPNWPLSVRGPGSVDIAVEGGVIARNRATGGDVDPWNMQAVEDPSATIAAANGASMRIRGTDSLAPVHVKLTAANAVWPAGACAETSGNTCTITLDPTREERLDIAFTAQ